MKAEYCFTESIVLYAFFYTGKVLSICIIWCFLIWYSIRILFKYLSKVGVFYYLILNENAILK